MKWEQITAHNRQHDRQHNRHLVVVLAVVLVDVVNHFSKIPNAQLMTLPN